MDKLTKKQLKAIEKRLDGREPIMISVGTDTKGNHETDFTNDTALDKLINKLAGEPELVGYGELMPVYVGRLKDIQEGIRNEQTAFDTRYAGSMASKEVAKALEAAKVIDPDIIFDVKCTSRKVVDLKNREHILMQLKPAKGLRYPPSHLDMIKAV